MLFVLFVNVFVFVHLNDVVVNEDAPAELADDDVFVNADVEEVLWWNNVVAASACAFLDGLVVFFFLDGNTLSRSCLYVSDE